MIRWFDASMMPAAIPDLESGTLYYVESQSETVDVRLADTDVQPDDAAAFKSLSPGQGWVWRLDSGDSLWAWTGNAETARVLISEYPQ